MPMRQAVVLEGEVYSRSITGVGLVDGLVHMCGIYHML